MITIEDIRKNIKKAIIESGIKQKKIAENIGVKQPTLSQYLNGRALPALDTFAKLCKYLDLDSNEILNIKDK